MNKNLGNRTVLKLVFLITLTITVGCGAGPYGFSRYYEPNDQEQPYFNQTRDYPYGVVAANPSDFDGQLISWFGIIESVQSTQDGRHLVRMTHNRHKNRHLCADERSSSCRVTVHYKSSGGFSVLLALEPADLVPGLDKIQPGSLLRVYGRVRCRTADGGETKCDYDEQGGIILDGAFYRHWPARYYVTTRRSSSLRR